MKKFILILALISFTTSFAQNDTAYNSIESFFITPAINYNLPGIGVKLSLGYNISKHFSIIFSSGYMSNSDVDINHKFIPINLGLKYNLNVFRVQSYILYQAGYNFLLKGDTYYNISNTNSSLGGGIGIGVLVPLVKTLQMDISYSHYRINNPPINIQSIGLGLNYKIK